MRAATSLVTKVFIVTLLDLLDLQWFQQSHAMCWLWDKDLGNPVPTLKSHASEVQLNEKCCKFWKKSLQRLMDLWLCALLLVLEAPHLQMSECVLKQNCNCWLLMCVSMKVCALRFRGTTHVPLSVNVWMCDTSPTAACSLSSLNMCECVYLPSSAWSMHVHSCSEACVGPSPFCRPIHSCLWSFFCMSLTTWLLCLRASASLILDMKWASITELDGQWSRSWSGKFWHMHENISVTVDGIAEEEEETGYSCGSVSVSIW